MESKDKTLKAYPFLNFFSPPSSPKMWHWQLLCHTFFWLALFFTFCILCAKLNINTSSLWMLSRPPKSFLNTSCSWFLLTTGPVQPCNQVFHDACWWSKSSLLLVDFILLQDPDSVSAPCCILHIIHKEAREALWVSSLDRKTVNSETTSCLFVEFMEWLASSKSPQNPLV